MWSGKRADCSPDSFRLQSVTGSNVLARVKGWVLAMLASSLRSCGCAWLRSRCAPLTPAACVALAEVSAPGECRKTPVSPGECPAGCMKRPPPRPPERPHNAELDKACVRDGLQIPHALPRDWGRIVFSGHGPTPPSRKPSKRSTGHVGAPGVSGVIPDWV